MATITSTHTHFKLTTTTPLARLRVESLGTRGVCVTIRRPGDALRIRISYDDAHALAQWITDDMWEEIWVERGSSEDG